jgi:hypothetical protein
MKLLLIAALLPAFLLTGCATAPATVASACQPKYIIGATDFYHRNTKVVKVDSINPAKSHASSLGGGVSCHARVVLSNSPKKVPGHVWIFSSYGTMTRIWSTNYAEQSREQGIAKYGLAGYIARQKAKEAKIISCSSAKGEADMEHAIHVLDRETTVHYMHFIDAVHTPNLSPQFPNRLTCYVRVNTHLRGTKIMQIVKVTEKRLSHDRGVEIWETGAR